jgi:TatD DNase family protein
MIDTHCHLEMEQFATDLDAVIKRAKESGIEAIITIGSDLAGCAGAVELSTKYDFIYAAVGIHPHDAKDFSEDIFVRIKSWVSEGRIIKPDGDTDESEQMPKVVAIGEIGLDYHYDLSPRDRQRDVFEAQLQFAREEDLPVIVHSREAEQDTLDILRRSGVNKGVMHCFSGDMKMAEETLAMGFHISIAGPVTFKKSIELGMVAKAVPDDRLLVETDAPYLAPVPYRGKRNEPAYLAIICNYLAEIIEQPEEQVSNSTTQNAMSLLGIK